MWSLITLRTIKNQLKTEMGQKRTGLFVEEIARGTGTVERKVGSDRRHSSRTTQNIDDVVEDLIVSQEDKPGAHRPTRQIARETGVAHRCTNCFHQRECIRSTFVTTTSRCTARRPLRAICGSSGKLKRLYTQGFIQPFVSGGV